MLGGEWRERLVGRVIGVAYLLPFLWFLWRGAVGADLKRRLWLIFGLGALQGAVGWWMVASGLTLRVEVSQVRLATHLVLALLIFAAIVWTLRRLSDRPPAAAISLQAPLGILTLLNQVPMHLALTHQAVAIVVLTLAVFQVERLAARQPEQAPQKLVLPVTQTG